MQQAVWKAMGQRKLQRKEEEGQEEQEKEGQQESKRQQAEEKLKRNEKNAEINGDRMKIKVLCFEWFNIETSLQWTPKGLDKRCSL